MQKNEVPWGATSTARLLGTRGGHRAAGFGIAILLAAGGASVAAPAAALVLACDPLQATFEVLPRASFSTYAHAVSRDGKIVAGFTENGSAGRPLLWDENGALQLLPFSPTNMHAFEISEPDPATGVRVVTGLGGSTGNYVRWVDGVLEDTGIRGPSPGVSLLATQWDSPIGAAPDGQKFVGNDRTAGGLGQPFVYDAPTGVLQTLPGLVATGWGEASGISDDGSVVGGFVYSADFDRVPALWTNGALQLLPPGTPCADFIGQLDSRVLDVSADGTVAVGRVWGCGAERSVRNAAIWRNGRLIELPMDLPNDPHGESGASAISVSPDGRYVVGTQNRTHGPAFIWDEQNGLRDLAVVLARDYGLTAEMATWALNTATDVTTLPDGSIVVVGYMWPRAEFAPRAFRGFRVTLDATCPDDDLDGLCNEWEEQQYVDVDCDGVKETPSMDLELPGADPQHKNIYVEIDYIAGTTMPAGTIADIETAFARVPNNLIGNPDGAPGITLLLDEDDPSLPPPVNPTLPPRFEWVDSTVCGMPDQFAAMKDAWFGNSLERGSPDLLAVKRRLFRYMIIGGGFPDFVVGKGALFGPDAVVAEDALASRDVAAGVVLHELGHTLGLHHGGPRDVVNYKPNYHSVMNYTWAIPARVDTGMRLGTNAYRASWVLDFARTAFAFDLDETVGMDETAGLGGPLAHTFHVVPVSPKTSFGTSPLAFPRLERESGGIDFDLDGGTLEPLSEPVNINNVNPADTRDPSITDALELLRARADWPFVAETLAASYEHPNWTTSGPATCSGLLLGTAQPREPTIAELRGLSVDLPIDCNANGIEDTDELNAGTATDDDGDFLLDECEPLAGDCDGDDDIDEDDRAILVAAFGRTDGEPEYRLCADLDRDRDVTLADYQAWVAAYEAAQATPAGCGAAGGGEAALLLGVWAWQRQRGGRRRWSARGQGGGSS